MAVRRRSAYDEEARALEPSFDTEDPRRAAPSFGGMDDFAPSYDQSPLSDLDVPGYQAPAPAPQTPAPGAAPTSGAAPGDDVVPITAVDRLETALNDLGRETDPGRQAQLRDQISRDVFTQLRAAGHEVSWEDDQTIVVDGRRYEVAGGTAAPGAGATVPGQAPAGWDQTKWSNPDHQTPKYQVGRILMSHPNTPDGRAAAVAQIAQQFPGAYQVDADEVYIPGVGMVDLWGGSAVGDWIPQFGVDDGMGGGAAAGAMAGAGGVPRASSAFTPLPTSAAGGSQPGGGFALSGPGYQPGDIGMDDIPDFSMQELLAAMGPSALDDEVAAASSRLLASPTAFDERGTDLLKARHKDELTELQRTAEDDLLNTSYAQGWAESPFARSELTASRRGRDTALAAGNRDIEIDAMARQKEDERAALGLASDVAGRQSAARQSAISTATSAALNRAALTGDRLALRESVNQAAAQLGLSGDALQLEHTLGVLRDATERLGIQIDADVAYATLSQRGREFMEDLALRYAQLAQQDAQFGASLGMDAARLQTDRDQFDTERDDRIRFGV